MGVLIASFAGVAATTGAGLTLWLAWRSGRFGWRIHTWACSKLERLRTLPRGAQGIEFNEREAPLLRRAQEVGYPLRLVTDPERRVLLTLDASR